MVHPEEDNQCGLWSNSSRLAVNFSFSAPEPLIIKKNIKRDNKSRKHFNGHEFLEYVHVIIFILCFGNLDSVW